VIPPVSRFSVPKPPYEVLLSEMPTLVLYCPGPGTCAEPGLMLEPVFIPKVYAIVLLIAALSC
jgi:hypothetical protein